MMGKDMTLRKFIATTIREYLNESKSNREKVLINGYEYWVDREKMVLYDKEESNNGISVWSSHLTKDESKQLMDYLKYGR